MEPEPTRAVDQRAITVLAVAERPQVRQRICRALAGASSVRVVGAVDSATSALEAMIGAGPEVIIITPRTKGRDAGEFIRDLDASAPGSRVIVLADSARQEDVLDMLRASARGYVVNATADAELPAAVTALAVGHGWLRRARRARSSTSSRACPRRCSETASAPRPT